MPATLIIHPDGRHVARYWETGTRPDYRWLTLAIAGPDQGNGMIEILLDNEERGVVAFGNEEGRLINLPANVPAMRRLGWPAPPEGWDAYDGNMGDAPMVQVFTSYEEYESAGPRWCPAVGPVVFLLGFAGLDDEGEYLDKQERTDDLGTDDASQIKAIMDRARDEAMAGMAEGVGA